MIIVKIVKEFALVYYAKTLIEPWYEAKIFYMFNLKSNVISHKFLYGKSPNLCYIISKWEPELC